VFVQRITASAPLALPATIEHCGQRVLEELSHHVLDKLIGPVAKRRERQGEQ
jgi:hypothetical protein